MEHKESSDGKHIYPLHRCVYFNEVENLKRLLDTEKIHDCNTRDCYGNTPLHLAVMLGHSACIDHLLESGARVNVENLSGWTAIDESICRKNPSTYKIWCRLQEKNQQKTEKIFFEHFLNQLPDLDCSLEWLLHSWIPFVSRFLPSDRFRIRKKGKKLRIDMTLKGFEGLKWIRGNISLLLDGEREFDAKCILLDHDRKVFDIITSQLAELDSAKFKSEWNLIINSPVSRERIHFNQFVCEPQCAGWFVSDSSRLEQIGSFSTKAFSLSNLIIDVKSRHEHISETAYNKALMSMLSIVQPSISAASSEIENEFNEPISSKTHFSQKESTKNTILPSWQDYRSGSLTENDLCFGNIPIIKKKSFNIGCSISFAQDIFFPIDVFLNLLNLYSVRSNQSDLRRKISETLPSGFPIRIEAQIFPTVTAKLTFTNIEYTKHPQLCYHNLEWSSCVCSNSIAPLIFTGNECQDDVFIIPLDYVPA